MKRSPLKSRRDTPRRKKHPIKTPWDVEKQAGKRSPRSNPKHLAWIRGQACCCSMWGGCSGDIVPMHVRCGTDGGTGIKPSDKWTIPGCDAHHREQHQIGEPRFEAEYNINMKQLARDFYERSPHKGE